MRRGGSHPINADDLKDVKSFDDLAKLFHEKLKWPEEKWETFPGVPALYGIPEKELEGVVELAAVQKLRPEQEWGIFLVDFGTNPLRRSSLRRILHAVATRARATHTNPTWPHDNILFIVRERDGKEFTFVHFRGDKLANARLRRFGWDESLEARTTLERCLPQLRWENQNRWNEAWDAEKLTKDFFAEYSRVFAEVESKVEGLTGDLRRRFTQSLFNRLMFLCFLQQKGWLEYPSGDTSARKRYLFTLFEKNPTEFYERLQLLFFSGLSSPNGAGGSRAALEREIGRVPFLNGGLFERDAELDTSSVTVPDEVFELILGRNGLFQRYTFTVTESTPMDVEVALDPEMLGKIFEELVTGRHESGSYYTPRAVVSFMCREALKGYLRSNSGVPPDDARDAQITKLVDEHDAEGIGVKDAKQLIRKLEAIKVCDPACGSGAYLLGMLQEIHALQQLLDTRAHEERSDYKRKEAIIRDCLYGVDIDQFAVNIAWLRLWLALVVDSDLKPIDNPDDAKKVALPNLDLKVEARDSLLAADPRAMLLAGGASLAKTLVQRFAELKREYLSCHEHAAKKTLRELISKEREHLQVMLNSAAPNNSLDWAVDYIEVFIDEEANVTGFDVVLANPPYVRQELIKDLKPALKKTYGDLFSGTADLYCYFYFRGVQLLAPGGMFVFISSNKWFRAAYGEKLRGFMAASTDIRSITDFGELPVFSAATFPMIFVAQKGLPGTTAGTPGTTAGTPGMTAGAIFTQVKTLAPPYPDVRALIEQGGFELPPDAIRGAEWTLADKDTLGRLRRMEESGVPLGEYVKGKIYRGILTGFNEAFVIDGAKRAELIAEDARSAEIIKPLAVGDDVRRWHIRDSGKWLIVTKIGVDMKRYPAIFEHLSRWKKELMVRRDRGEHWWELRACAYYAEFDKPKIVFPDIAMESRFTFDPQGTFVTNTTYMAVVDDLFLLGVLNSSPMWWFCGERLTEVGDADERGRLRFFRVFVERLPIPRASDADRDAIAALVQKCLDAKATDPAADVSHYEAEIDARVEFLYFHQHEAPTYDEWVAKKEAERGTVIEEIRHLLQTGHETDQLECKSSFSWDVKKGEFADWLKDEVHTAICALLNAKGGELLIGVDDDMSVVGLERDLERYGNKDKLIQAIEGPLGKTLLPNPIGLVDIKAVDIDGKTIVRVKVKPDNAERYEFKDQIYVRRNSRSKPPLTAAEAASWWSKRQRGEV
ncbi:MAG: class I SAM-dependent DNA methyltransferase [Armatimonadetes bacterium]|nr:class I SAM-dependent DNA methyltransferase [Armatimonadota bacterium]NOG92435.1 class I SAM-dependent DNA methyltransferase [Armatimonadota bacterium]